MMVEVWKPYAVMGICNMKPQMNIVIIGHVDHGKSTVIGRLLADTKSLPEGKLEQVKAMCKKNARPFEYAFLLDALKDEQAQGITIDAARCFFNTVKRDYIVLDAPGHIEFLKNMVTGASRAEAALLVIDAKEGIRENSKRHGYLASMLGIKQVSVLVNKLDLVDYREDAFNSIKEEYTNFLHELKVKPVSFIPISAREGDNIASKSDNMGWYKGDTVLTQLDGFGKEEGKEAQPFRFPIQDIYKFTAAGDDRRILAGIVESGKVCVGDDVVFLPSGKTSTVNSVEAFNVPLQQKASAGECVGFTLDTQIYIRPGELMVKALEDSKPQVSSRFKANIFWLGRAPFIKNKIYKLKLATTRIPVKLIDIINVVDASELDSVQTKQQVERHDVAECVFETSKPIAFDTIDEIETTGRFVIVDDHEIAGGGTILEGLIDQDSSLKGHIAAREKEWERGLVEMEQRAAHFGHRSKFVVITGEVGIGKQEFARALEKDLFDNKFNAYYLGISNVEQGLDSDMQYDRMNRVEQIRRLGELARIMTDSGQIFITTISDVDDYDVEHLKLLNAPNEILVINIGVNNFGSFEVDANFDSEWDVDDMVEKTVQLLRSKAIILEYYI